MSTTESRPPTSASTPDLIIDAHNHVWPDKVAERALGGNIPERDHARLATAGVDAIFPTSSSFTDIAEWLREHALEATSGKETEVPHRPGR